MRTDSRCTVVLAGCRAYGQALLGDVLTDADRVNIMRRFSGDGDWQLVLGAKVVGREYEFSGIKAAFLRSSGSDWREVPTDAYADA